MSKKPLALLPSIALVSSLFFLSFPTPEVHGSPGLGLVCVTASGMATNCPAHPPAITNMAVNQNFTVGIFIQGSDPMHSFDIYAKVDNTILNPIKAVLGPLIKSPSSTLICINGVSVMGTCTLGTVNGAGVVEVSTIESGPGNECVATPCSGMAFNITYAVSAATGFTSIDYPSVSTCSPSSVPGTTRCVLLRDSVGTPVGENVQPASYGAATPSLISVVVGVEGGLYWSGMYSDAWTNWQSLSGASPSSPGLCASEPGSVELVVRGYDNNVYHKSFSAGTWSTTWDHNPTGVTIDQPLCTVLGDQLHVIVRGVTSGLWDTTFNLTSRTWASGWVGLGADTPSMPALVPLPNGAITLVVRGFNNGIYSSSFTNGAWTKQWTLFDNPAKAATISSPAATFDGNYVHIVVRGTDSSLYENILNCFGCFNWTRLNGSSPIAPTLVSAEDGTMHVVVRGFDNTVYEKSAPRGCCPPNTAWDPNWNSANGSTQTGIAAVMVGSTLSIVVSGSTSELWYNSLTGNTWSGWLLLGGATHLDPSLVVVP